MVSRYRIPTGSVAAKVVLTVNLKYLLEEGIPAVSPAIPFGLNTDILPTFVISLPYTGLPYPHLIHSSDGTRSTVAHQV
jgi:hypothetical protein